MSEDRDRCPHCQRPRALHIGEEECPMPATPKWRHDPACLLLDPDHDGPHVVPPDHPAMQNPLVYRCRVCGWAFHDPSWGDIEDHWEGGHDTRPTRAMLDQAAEALETAG